MCCTPQVIMLVWSRFNKIHLWTRVNKTHHAAALMASLKALQLPDSVMAQVPHLQLINNSMFSECAPFGPSLCCSLLFLVFCLLFEIKVKAIRHANACSFYFNTLQRQRKHRVMRHKAFTKNEQNKQTNQSSLVPMLISAETEVPGKSISQRIVRRF